VASVTPVGPVAPLARQRQLTVPWSGTANSAVASGKPVAAAVVPVNGTKSKLPLPAALLVVMVMTPVLASTAMLDRFGVAAGAVPSGHARG
jgi:hypothetical protein